MTRARRDRTRAVATVAVVTMLLALVPGVASAGPLVVPYTSVRLDGIPSEVSVGQTLTVSVVDSAPGTDTDVHTQPAVDLSIPTDWSLVAGSATSDAGAISTSVLSTDDEFGLDWPVEGVLADRYRFEVDGGDGQFSTVSGETLLSFAVVVGPSPIGGPFEVADVFVGEVNAFTRTTVSSGWDVRQPNVVSTGAVYPLAVTNVGAAPLPITSVELDVPAGLDLVDSPLPDSSVDVGGGRRLLTYVLPADTVVAPGADALELAVVASTPSLATGNGALEIIRVDVIGPDGEGGQVLVHEEESFSFVEHAVRVVGTPVLEPGDVGTYSLVDARGSPVKDGFPNSTMDTARVELTLPTGVSYVTGSSSVGEESVETGPGTVAFTGPFTTEVGETLLTFSLGYDGSNPGEEQPVDVRSTPVAPAAPTYDSTLPDVAASKLFALDLAGTSPWVLTGGGFTAQGPGAFVRLAADGSDGGPVVLEYDNAVPSTGGLGASISPPITVETVATAPGPVTLAYDLSGFHAFFAVEVTLEAFVTGDATTTQVLYDPPRQSCCTTPSNGFADEGEVVLDVLPGDSYGLRITGSNGDLNSRLLGTLVIGDPEPPVEPDAPEVAVLAAARDVSLGTLDALGRLVGEPDTPYLLSFAGADVDALGCEATAPLGAPVPVVTDGDGVVDFGATFTRDDVATEPGSTEEPPLPARLVVVAATQLAVVDTGEGFTTEEVARFDAGTGFPGSNCVFVGFGNDAWTSALELPAQANATQTAPTRAVADVIEQPGGTRWYRFPVRPNGRATIDVTGLPDDYDLTVFTDIRQEYVEITSASPEDALNRLGAEFAPSAFSPSAFSPSAFSPSAFSPSAFSPSAFSPSAFSAAGFSPSAFSPSAFSPSAFSPDATSPSAFSPSAFSPSAFSPSAFSPEAYASAQVQALVTVSANPGTLDELAVVNTWNNDTEFYVRVAAKPGAADLAPFDVRVELDGASCAGVTRGLDGLPAVVPVTTGPHETVIVWDSQRLPGSDQDVLDVGARLDDLAAATAGVVVDLADQPRVQRYQDQADANPQCVYAANLVADATKDVIDTVRPTSPDLRDVVIVGDDSVVPFFRYPDTALLGPESDYVPPVADQTRSQASLRENYVLGQDQYGASTVLSLGGMQVPIPQLAVGRLVEEPDEIIGMIDQFLDPQSGQPRGALRPDSTLVTGYDFMTDAAAAIQDEFVAGTSDPTAPGANVNDELVAPAGQAPGDPAAWTADDLRDEWLAPAQKHDLVYLAGHFSANSALAADYQTQLVTTEIAPSGVDLAGSVVFSNGCHSGYNIVDGDGVPGLTLGLDWAQAMARERATFIGGTGYQYGDTDLVEYSERLYAGFARELRRGTGAVAVGEALVRAKRDYLASTPDPRGLHRKSLLIATVFGLPMAAVDMPGERVPVDESTSTVTPTTVAAKPGSVLGLQRAQLSLGPGLGLDERAVTLDVLDGDGLPVSTVESSYLAAGDGRTAVQPNEPILPLLRTDVTVPGTSLRGVAFRGGAYTDTDGVVPLSSAAGTELRGVHVPFASEVLFPMRVATANYYDALPGGERRTRLLTTPVQHRVDRVGDPTATRRVFDRLDLALFYSDNTETYTGTDEFGQPFSRTPALAAPPQIADVRFSRALDAAGAPTDDLVVEVRVVGDPAAGLQSVWITTTTGPDPVTGVGEWVPVDLTRSPNDSRRWGAVLPGAAASGAPALDVVAHAVNGVGLVSTDDNFGRFHRTGGDGVPTPGQEPAVPSPTTLTLTPPVAPVVGSTVTVAARLTDDTGTGLAGRPVLVTFGSGGRTVVTDGDGTATATFLAANAVGDVPVTAAFRGDAGDLLAPSSAATTVQVAPASTTLLSEARADGGVAFTLVDGNGRRVPEVTLLLDVAPGPAPGVADVARITDQTGQVVVPAGLVPPEQEQVGASFAGTATLLPSEAVVTPAPAAPAPPTLSPAVIAVGEGTDLTAALPSVRGAVSATVSLVDTLGDRLEVPGSIDADRLLATARLDGLSAGVYEVTVEVASADLTSPPSGSTMLVVYDPDGGSVSGAGWIVPSSGDVLPSFDGTGDDRAHFGFNVRYRPGRSEVPAGTARFRYRAGGLDLDASEFAWLVVTNPTGGIFRGLAEVTIDGEEPTAEPWAFQMDVREREDGDEFGIKIWAPGRDPDVDAPTYRVQRNPIGGGTVNVKSS